MQSLRVIEAIDLLHSRYSYQALMIFLPEKNIIFWHSRAPCMKISFIGARLAIGRVNIGRFSLRLCPSMADTGTIVEIRARGFRVALTCRNNIPISSALFLI